MHPHTIANINDATAFQELAENIGDSCYHHAKVEAVNNFGLHPTSMSFI